MSARRAALALILAAGVAPAFVQAVAFAQTSAPADEIAAVVVSGDKATRVVDCHGADLTVIGNDNVLAVTGCSTYTIPGNGNRIRARLLESSSISASGNRNVVTWTPAPGWSPRVSATGTGNRIDPEFSPADMRPNPVRVGAAKP